MLLHKQFFLLLRQRCILQTLQMTLDLMILPSLQSLQDCHTVAWKRDVSNLTAGSGMKLQSPWMDSRSDTEPLRRYKVLGSWLHWSRRHQL